ncbi:hypothetical protein DCMF_26325 [Candidatus Formimonas warabiya]|uniref:Uncharacterized protein n=1 Tax=Formimonas warabiya TaxID=1761012 RepID=A0A3G1KZ68_FORW1|nr:hypothetical protein DCMF_26325 [Candidatus Formimonas warabiya]
MDQKNHWLFYTLINIVHSAEKRLNICRHSNILEGRDQKRDSLFWIRFLGKAQSKGCKFFFRMQKYFASIRGIFSGAPAFKCKIFLHMLFVLVFPWSK